MTNPTAIQLAKVLFLQQQRTESIDIFTLQADTGWSVYRVLHTLDELGQLDLVDVRRVRLTLSGLAFVAGVLSANELYGQEPQCADADELADHRDQSCAA